MSYLTEFNEALEFTKQLGINSVPFIKVDRSCKTEDYYQLPHRFREEMGLMDIEQLMAQCVSFNYQIQPLIDKYLKCKSHYTIGYITIGGEKRFYTPKEDLVALLKTGARSPEMQLHVWLTLDSGEIYDATFMTTFAVAQGIKEGRGGVVCEYHEDLKGGLTYHPQIIGTEYLKRIGGLIEFSVF